MSAYLVDKATIDVLVQAALVGAQDARGIPVGERNHGDEFSWWDPKLETRVYLSRYAQPAEVVNGRVTPDFLGRLLWTENVRSLMARYPRDDWSADMELAQGYVFVERRAVPMTGKLVIGCIDNLRYQSCEHGEEWRGSSAFAALDALDHRITRQAIGRGPWGVSDAELDEMVSVSVQRLI